MTPRSLDEIRAFFSADRFATIAAGIVIDEVAPPPQSDSPNCCVVPATVSMPITPNHLNAGGSVMGGAIFSLADFCVAVGTNAYYSDALTVSTSASMSFVGVCRGSKLVATLSPVHVGRTMVVCRVDIADDLGNLVAIATFDCFVKKLKK